MLDCDLRVVAMEMERAKAWPGGGLRFDCGGPAARDCPAVLAPRRRLRNSPSVRLRRLRCSDNPRRPRLRRGNLRAAALLGAAEALRPPPGHAFANTIGAARRGGGGRLSARLCARRGAQRFEGCPRAARVGEDCLSTVRGAAAKRASSAAAFGTRAPQGSRRAATTAAVEAPAASRHRLGVAQFSPASAGPAAAAARSSTPSAPAPPGLRQARRSRIRTGHRRSPWREGSAWPCR